MKETSSLESSSSDIFPKPRARSRTDTVASSLSISARSLSDISSDLASRPSSRQSSADGGMPLHERHEKTAKAFLAKGTRILKRQGSKLNLLSSQLEDRSNDLPDVRAGEPSPVRSLQRQPTLSSRRPGVKRSISGPFAFQHVTHGDQARFLNLDSVGKTDLTSEFNALQTGQEPDSEIRGIPVADLPVKQDDANIEIGLDEPASPTTDAIPLLPTTPTRPRPPPKDGLMSPSSPSDFRMSRSMENFSRPTRMSVTALDISPTTATTQQLSVMSPVSQTNALAKPLPHLPGDHVVHAVSTRDDIALPLRTAPLPSPPKVKMEVVEEETAEEGASLEAGFSCHPPPAQHVLPETTPRQLKRRSQSSGEVRFGVISYDIPPRICTPGAATIENTGQEANRKCKNRISIGVKPIDIEGWEDAIDYSWEHAAELEAEDDMGMSPTLPRHPYSFDIPQENFLVVEQSVVDEASSSASTPLMMHAANKPSRDEPARSEARAEGQSSSPLLGLGIDSSRPLPSVLFTESVASVPQEAEDNFSSNEIYRSRDLRSPASVMSVSSSQESFIASIFGTHRSSNSSTTLSDFAHLAGGSFGGSMEHLKLDLQDFPTVPAPEKHIREGSQDTIREDSQHPKSMEGLADLGVLSPLSMSPIGKCDFRAARSQTPSIPERTSSVADALDYSKLQIGRKRTTGTARPRRNTRISYSLFPAPPTH
ncbi:hypothetical protein A1O7_03187 [Cladophialophora yegresii CBS 114405]|uniref:CRIB domain-containing protein n=1 Tax=Cladophialophora yegresii CBS 114405 TaxID=1182544 RepID=W9WWS9_9EURO|nr:uncharacterized protein A1O7_03187 [Cladophialophora yegresii CBS 114405]EXJ62749.1 hypothetical protein A1O7_03187 [Cladophialophora yegresii CBS 114405]